jgi:hypothetical protein
MIIESPIVKISKSKNEVLNFIQEISNFKNLMPENISKFEVTGENSFKFALQGMPEFELKLVETDVNNAYFTSASEKIAFKLKLNVTEIDALNSQSQFIFEGDFNAMMAMMIKSPISNFLKILSENISKI